MKKLMVGSICLLMMVSIGHKEARSQLFEPSFEFEKVIGNIYVGKQGAPLTPILGTPPGTYLAMNLYVIVSEDRSELLLIDGPGLPGLLPPLLTALETEFPEAAVKAVLLTHGHIDHCWAAPYFASIGIPVYASAAEIAAPPGPYGAPLSLFATAIAPGFSIPIGDGVVTALDLTGHTPGHLGYAYYPDGKEKKINHLFAGDAVLAPADHGASEDPFDITYLVRSNILEEDTFSLLLWGETLVNIKDKLTPHAKLFPGHGAIRKGYLWRDPIDYIDHTIIELNEFPPE